MRKIKTSSTPFTLPDDVYAAIGEVAVSWSGVEILIARGLAMLLKTDYGLFIAVASNMNLSPQIDAAMTLCHLVLPENERDGMLKILERVRTMNTERNKIVHGRWIQTNKPHVVLRISARAAGTPSEKTELMTAKSIRNFAKQIRELSQELANYFLECGLFNLEDLRGNGAEAIAE